MRNDEDSYGEGYANGSDSGYNQGQAATRDIVLESFKNLLNQARMYSSDDGIWPLIIKEAEESIKYLEEI